jgi:hypothetical protein
MARPTNGLTDPYGAPPQLQHSVDASRRDRRQEDGSAGQIKTREAGPQTRLSMFCTDVARRSSLICSYDAGHGQLAGRIRGGR